MSLSCGLIGLPNVGKSTIFNALTAAGAQVANYPFTTIEPNRGLAVITDPRLERLAELAAQSQAAPATVEFVDIAGLVQGASQGQGLGNQFLGHVRDVDAVIHVIRCFQDPNVAHVDPVIDPVRDADLIQTELALADLEVLERRRAKLNKPAQSGDKEAKVKLAACDKFTAAIQEGRPPDPAPEDEPILAELGLLTAKPMILAANVNEDELSEKNLLPGVEAMAREQDAPLVVICGDLEAEMVELEPAERAEFLASLGQEESGLERLIRTARHALDLITFFTVIGREVRAWPVRQGTTAAKGAGKIHTDMAKGFIAAEVIPFEDLTEAGSLAAARETGQVRLEGRDYALAEGDVVTFRFSV